MSNTLGFGLDVNRGGAGYKYQSETVTLLRALTGTYSTPRKIEIDKLIKSLKAAGIWSKLDVLQMYAAPTAADAVVNWKSPGTYNATLVNSPTFTANRGITAEEAKGINSGFNPGDGGVYKYLLNDCSIGLGYSGTNTGTTFFGVFDGTNIIGFNDLKQLRVNSSSLVTFTDGVFATAGILSFNRTNSSTVNGYKNGGTGEPKTLNSTAIPNFNIYVNSFNSSGSLVFSAVGIVTRLFYAGGALTESEVMALSTALETYLDYIGAGVIT